MRQRVREAFVATGASHAATTADKVLPWVDEQVEAWRRARTEACSNGEVHGRWSAELLDRAVWCLGDRRSELEVLIDEFAGANATVVKKAEYAPDLELDCFEWYIDDDGDSDGRAAPAQPARPSSVSSSNPPPATEGEIMSFEPDLLNQNLTLFVVWSGNQRQGVARPLLPKNPVESRSAGV